MKSLSRTLFVSLILGHFLVPSNAAAQVGTSPAGVPRIEQRKPLPIFEIPFVEGDKTLSTSTLRGQVTVIFFWATWCQFCKRRMPALPQIQASFPGARVQTLLLNVDSDRGLAQKFLDEHPSVKTSLFDQDLRIKKMASVRAIPYSLILDDKGVVRYVQEGDRANEISILIRKVKKLVPVAGAS